MSGAVVLGVDLGFGDELDAEGTVARARDRLVAAGFGEDCWICTYAVELPAPRHAAFAVSVAGEPTAVLDAVRAAFALDHAGVPSAGHHRRGPAYDEPVVALAGQPAADGRSAGALAAVAAHHARAGGRAVVYPGSDRLRGRVTVATVLGTAIEQVANLGGGPVAPDDVVVTSDFVRPRWTSGQLVLHVLPGSGGTLVPFEQPDPHRCCEDH